MRRNKHLPPRTYTSLQNGGCLNTTECVVDFCFYPTKTRACAELFIRPDVFHDVDPVGVTRGMMNSTCTPPNSERDSRMSQ